MSGVDYIMDFLTENEATSQHLASSEKLLHVYSMPTCCSDCSWLVHTLLKVLPIGPPPGIYRNVLMGPMKFPTIGIKSLLFSLAINQMK